MFNYLFSIANFVQLLTLMKLKLTGYFFFLFITFSFAQGIDSTATDTISFPDSSGIIFRDSVAADSAALLTSFADTTVVDTISPLYQQPFNSNSTFISHDEILRTDYEYTGEAVELFPFPFTNNPSYYGQPENFNYSGVYPEITGFYNDKILLDNRFSDNYNSKA